jgi:hypothetical protein
MEWLSYLCDRRKYYTNPGLPTNIESFGGNPNKTGKLLPLASVSVLYDVRNDILVDVTLNAYRYNERTSAKNIYHSFLIFLTPSYCLIVAILPKNY